jgi:uncharacterized protein (DUF1800 family)
VKPWRGPFGAAEAAHLLRRAAFAPAAGEVEQAVRAGPEATVARLLAAPLPDKTEVEQSLRSADDPVEIAGAILHRAASSQAPLRENLSLFFHNHFVSAFSKVREARMMLDQLELFRGRALGPFADLVKAVGRDPAMVRYLDLERSTRSQPNENFARELLELFTTGPGPYGEEDIREAARAFTGHHLRNGRFVFSEAAHDPGPKTVLGQRGPWSGDDVAAIAAGHSATAGFLARKLARHFIADDPPERVVSEVEGSWRKHGGEIGPIVREILLSESFHAPEQRYAVTRSPAALVVATGRALGCSLPALSAARHCFSMGQALLDPPSVKGYPGGGRWLNAATLLARRRFVLETLAEGARKQAVRPDVLAAAEKGAAEAFAAVLGRAPSPDEAAAVGRGFGGAAPGQRVFEVLELVVLHPSFQRC